VLIGSSLLSLLLVDAGTHQKAEDDATAIPLLLRSRWAGTILLFALPATAVLVSLPHYDMTRLHWLGVSGLLLAYVIITMRLVAAHRRN